MKSFGAARASAPLPWSRFAATSTTRSPARLASRATIEPPRLRQLIRLVWQTSTVAWIGGGVLLIAAPLMASEPARHWIIATLACVFAFAAFETTFAFTTPVTEATPLSTVIGPSEISGWTG